MAQDCIFCKINQGQVKSDLLHRDDRCFVIRDIAARAPVHLLIIPNQHVTYLTNMSPEQETLVGHLFLVARDMAKREGVASTGYRLVINQGPDGGQEVAHLHLHLLGGRALRAIG